MAFFDKIGEFAKNVGDKTGDMIEINKLNSKINSERANIDALYKKIGEHYWAQFTAGIVLDDDAAALCAEIRSAEEAVAAIQAEIQAIRAANTAPAQNAVATSASAAQVVICPSCGADNAPETKFCQECGTKLKASAPAPSPGVCPACGAENAPGTKFCGACGAKL